MKNEKTIQEEVEKTLRVLDLIHKVKADPLLAEKIEHLTEMHGSPNTRSFQYFAMAAAACLALLIAANIFTLMHQYPESETYTEASDVIADSYQIYVNTDTYERIQN